MASLDDRWYRVDTNTGKRLPTDLHGRGKRWRVRYRDPAGKNRAPCFDRKDDALRHKAEVEGRLHKGTWLDPDRARVTVSEVAEGYLAAKDATRKPTTAFTYRQLWTSLVAPRWGDVPVSAVTYGDVTSWVGSMVAQGLSPSRVRQAHRVLRAVLDIAVRDRRIDSNPAARVDLPSMPMRGEHLYLSPAELMALADAAGEHYAPLILTLGLCGLRWGEAAALRVGDVDTLRKRLHIRFNLTSVNGTLVETSPKTHQARWVPMPPQVIAAVTPLLNRPPQARLFTTEHGTDLRSNNFSRAVLKPAATKVGLEGLKVHSLRHTAVSMAVRAGGSVKDVQRMVGHARASMTLDVYADVFEEGLDDLAERIGRIADTPATQIPRLDAERG